MHKRQAGFSVLDALLIVIILVLMGFGWYIFQAKKKAQDTNKNADSSQTTTADTSSRPAIPAGWTWYDNKELGYAFAYPKAWTFEATQTETCPFGAKLYGSTGCPLVVKFSPKEYTDEIRNRPESLVGSVAYEGTALMDEAAALNSELEQAANAKATVERQENIQINKQKAFYLRTTTSDITDNVWVVRFDGFYVRFTNREHNTTYYSGKVSYTSDYARYTATIERIIKTTIAL